MFLHDIEVKHSFLCPDNIRILFVVLFLSVSVVNHCVKKLMLERNPQAVVSQFHVLGKAGVGGFVFQPV
jgi:hypothetical protein